MIEMVGRLLMKRGMVLFMQNPLVMIDLGCVGTSRANAIEAGGRNR